MNVSQFFRSIFIRRQIWEGKEFVNDLTNQVVYKDPYWDSESEWEARGVRNVCCLGSCDHCSDDVDVDIDEIALRIACEDDWRIY